MNTKRILGVAAVAAALAVVPAAEAGGTPPRATVSAGTPSKVSVRVEGLTKTLLRAKTVQPKRGWITRYGAPSHKCAAASAQGALQLATKGRWKGSWYASYDEYFITSILGVTESGTKDYWEVFVDNVAASSGACEIALHKGEKLLFAAVPVTGSEYPTAISGPSAVTAGKPFTVKAVLYNAKGKPHALKGATVSGGGLKATTNAKGKATLTAKKSGRLVLTASDKGEIRSETVVEVSG